MGLTGIHAQENQARRLLHNIAGFSAQLGDSKRPSEAEIAARWLSEVYEPVLAAIPAELRQKLEPAEIFHQLLEHRWFLSEAEGHNVGLEAAVASYAEHVGGASAERDLLAVGPM